ncbi:cytochrome c biogenesis protein CcmE [Chromatiales bacterium (ex Bugula neritina AB1)]|nr:cytochrome c biogenesis protein CcmE [Chromatiales bacterium (ex Bugula neritina AB1)]
MNPVRKQRLILITLMILGVGGAVSLLLKAFNSNIQLFYSPSEVIAGEVPQGAEFKIGGLVSANSVVREGDGLTVQFDLTDNGETVPVRYTGILPDLFREGQGTVSIGKLDNNGVFIATKVLAKHDENYMPPEVADALEKTAAKKHGQNTVNLQ